MAGKKIGSLSKSMIIRRKPRESTGFVLRQEPVAEPDEPAETEGGGLTVDLEPVDTLVIPRHGAEPEAGREPASGSWGTAKVVPLHPRSGREAPSAEIDQPSIQEGKDAERRADTLDAAGLRSELLSGISRDRSLSDPGPENQTEEPSAPSLHSQPQEAPGASAPWPQLEIEGGEASNDLLVRALRSADLGTAEALFGRLAGLSSVAALEVLYDTTGEDLALACRAMGMDQLQFVSVYILSRKLGLGEEALAPQDLARLVALFEASDLQEAQARLKAIQEGKSGAVPGPFRHD